MQIVIDIPIEWLFDMKNKKFCQTDSLYQKILNGTPLPEGHGRLIDADELKKHKYHDNDRFENAVAVAQIDWAETIIEADIPTMYYPQVEGITPTVISSNGSDMLSAEEIDNLLQALAEGESEDNDDATNKR